MSRLRKIQLSRPKKAVVLAATGALSVATAASAVAATSAPDRPAGPEGAAKTSAGRTHVVARPKAQTASKARAAGAAGASGSPRQIAKAMLSSYRWSSGQFACLNPLWQRESSWNATAANPGSGAYGIAQALPASRMASAGPDWRANAATQIKWGLGYIRDTYGSPCAAWNHEQAAGWY